MNRVQPKTKVKMATNKTKTLYDYFSPEKRLSAAQICLPIIEELIASSVATVATGKRHSGKTVRKETFALWLRQFPWLILERQEGQTKLKCNLCIKGNIKNVWAEGGLTKHSEVNNRKSQ